MHSTPAFWRSSQGRARAWTGKALLSFYLACICFVFLPFQSHRASGHSVLRDATRSPQHAPVAVAIQGFSLRPLQFHRIPPVHSTLTTSPQLQNVSRGCRGGDFPHTVVSGDTVSAIAFTSGMASTALAAHNSLPNPNLILIGQVLCIPGSLSIQAPSSNVNTFPSFAPGTATTGRSNPYPYGQCTWWANERFSQLHGVFVPWTTNANAWQWSARASDFGWHVASTPSVGAIVDLQPWVQGASSLGHVAYVEQVLSNGNVRASNLNWGANPGTMVDVEFSPGPGVTFLNR